MKLFNQADYVGRVIAKLMKIHQNQHADFLRFIFTEDSLKIKEDLELFSDHTFCRTF